LPQAQTPRHGFNFNLRLAMAKSDLYKVKKSDHKTPFCDQNRKKKNRKKGLSAAFCTNYEKEKTT